MYFSNATDVDVGQAKDAIEVVVKVFELGAAVTDFAQIFKISGSFLSVFPVVGALLTLIGSFLPDVKHQEILKRLDYLSYKIDLVRDDIRKLGHDIRWDLTEHKFGTDVDRIELGIRYVVDIGRATTPSQKKNAKDRLKNLFVNRDYILALDNLLEGITGTGLLKSSSILDNFDLAVAKGHRKKISALATPLLKVASGGILVVATYEAMMYGEDEAKRYMQQHGYDSQLEAAFRKTQSVLDRCVHNFRQNMLVDLNSFLDTGRANKDLRSDISNFMSDKYDWLENFVLVYKDMKGFDNHCIGGYRVSSLHRNNKCGIIFYRTKGAPAKFSNRYEEAFKIIDGNHIFHAQNSYNSIQTKMAEKGIGLLGCAVIRHERVPKLWHATTYYNPDLWWGGTFSHRTAVTAGPWSSRHPSTTKFVMLQ